MMGGYGYGFGYGLGPLSMIIWIVVLIAVAAVVVWVVRSAGSSGRDAAGERPPRSPGLDILEERYSRGEIGRDEFLEKKKDLGG